MRIDYESIGNRIKEIRLSKKWTQAYLAEMSEVEPSNISHIERAATKVSLPTLVNIANALGVTLDEIMVGSLIQRKHISSKIIDDILFDCTPKELSALTDVLKNAKLILRKFTKE
ncbi:MAG: helix-turn-helix transcriptional regulator [Ruminococcaceae bacterium]|nr:helix-turn-helix transcriptional regulator [Oscillospiraceae bacterium]